MKTNNISVFFDLNNSFESNIAIHSFKYFFDHTKPIIDQKESNQPNSNFVLKFQPKL